MKLGWKASLLDHRLQFATAIFDAEYKDVQVPGSAGCFSSAACQTFCGITTNAGKARFRGVELETQPPRGENIATPGDRFTYAGSLGYLDAQSSCIVTRDAMIARPPPSMSPTTATFRTRRSGR